MTAASASPLGDLAADNVAGQVEMDRTLGLVKSGVAHPDEVYRALLDVWGKFGNAGLLGAARRLQKSLERVP